MQGQKPDETPGANSFVHTSGSMNLRSEEDEAYLKSLPLGFSFDPLDFELVVYYLKKKVYGESLPPNRIKEVQLYNYDPKTLTEMSNNKSFNGTMNEWYFFTPRDRKYRNGSRPSRRAGDGFWKATGADKRIRYNGDLVGLKKTLVFCKGKQPHGEKTNWIMHEYVLCNPLAKERASNDDMRLNDWVLCRLHQNQRGTNRKQEETEAAIPPPQSDQQFQVEHFNTPPQQTYPMPFYNNAFDNSTSGGLLALPDPILEPASAIFPQHTNFIPSVGPPDDFHYIMGYDYDTFNIHQQQQQFGHQYDSFNIQQQQFSNTDAEILLDPDWGFGSS